MNSLEAAGLNIGYWNIYQCPETGLYWLSHGDRDFTVLESGEIAFYYEKRTGRGLIKTEEYSGWPAIARLLYHGECSDDIELKPMPEFLLAVLHSRNRYEDT